MGQGKNPYVEGNSKVSKDIKRLCLTSGTGIMFKLFDLGKLGLQDKDKIFVFKNNIGILVRKFVNDVESGNNYGMSLKDFELGLKKLGKFALSDVGKYEFYEESIERILMELQL